MYTCMSICIYICSPFRSTFLFLPRTQVQYHKRGLKVNGVTSGLQRGLDLMGLITGLFGRHYLSNATCLTRPRLLYALFVVSRSTIMRCIVPHV